MRRAGSLWHKTAGASVSREALVQWERSNVGARPMRVDQAVLSLSGYLGSSPHTGPSLCLPDIWHETPTLITRVLFVAGRGPGLSTVWNIRRRKTWDVGHSSSLLNLESKYEKSIIRLVVHVLRTKTVSVDRDNWFYILMWTVCLFQVL